MRPKKFSSALLPLAAVGILVSGLLSCPVNAPDFSAWNGTNLIPGFGFDNLAWIPDGDTQGSDGNAVTRTADAAGNFSNTYISLTRVDTLTFGSPIRYTAADSGFASSTALYSGLSASAGTNPPVYRLETKNLFVDGDFENGASLAAGFSGLDNAGSSPPSFIKATEASSGGGNQLKIVLESSDSLDLDLSVLVSDFSLTAPANYNLGFKFLVSRESFSSFWNPSDQANRVQFIAAYPRDSNDAVLGSGTWVRFPFGTNPAKSASTLNVSAGTKIFRINLKDTAPADPLNPLWIDNFQVMNLNTALGVRLKVPYKLLDASGNTLRPELMEGGTYTLTMEVRRDPGVLDENTRRLNSFSADSLSVSVHTMATTQNSTTPNPTTCLVNTVTPAMDAWTTVSNDFTSLIQNIDPATIQDGDILLELYLAPSNVRTDANKTPGAILITAPRLYWSPN